MGRGGGKVGTEQQEDYHVLYGNWNGGRILLKCLSHLGTTDEGR